MTLADIRDARIEALTRRVNFTALAGMHLFLTGCTGFVGTWLLTALAALNRQGAGIRATLLSRAPDVFLARYPHFAAMEWLTVIAGDVLDGPIWLTEPVDWAIHGAASVSPANPSDNSILRTVVSGTRNVLDWACRVGVSRIICISSGAVYGSMQPGEKTIYESQPCRPNPSDAYACSKLTLEAQALACARAGGPAVIIARLFTFSGLGLAPHLALPQFMNMAAAGKPIVLSSDGSSIRSYLDAGDMAVWLLALLSNAPNGTICNVGSDASISLAQLAQHISQHYGKKCDVALGATPSSTRSRYVPDITLAQQQFGLEAWTPLTDSLDEYFAWLTRAPKDSRS